MSKTLLIFLHLVISLILETIELSIKMIPIDSPQLQIVPNDYTVHQRIKLLANLSISRVYNYRKWNTSLAPTGFKTPLLGLKSSYYVTNLMIGSAPGARAAYLLIDTGSSQTWLQCEGCNPCFQLGSGAKNFSYQASNTYRQMSVHDSLCQPPRSFRGSCGFNIKYGDGSYYAKGIIGTDDFRFQNARTQDYEVYRNIAFGCGLENVGIQFGAETGPQNIIAGIHGLAPSHSRSFLVQPNIAPYIRNRFSYCLPSWRYQLSATSIMYFGDEAQISGDATRTVQSISMVPNAKYYFLYLTGISVDGNRLPIDPSIFDPDPQHATKGFIIDSGAPYSVLAESAYEPLREEIVEYFFNNYGWRPSTRSGRALDLCYDTYPTGTQTFPSVILHFSQYEGHVGEVDMVMDKDNMFERISTPISFCMAVESIPDPGPSFLGAFQHSNFWVLYDVENWILSFVPADCTANTV